MTEWAGWALGQAIPARDPTRVLMVVGLLIVTVLAAGLVIMAIRKRLFAEERESGGPALMMEELRAMRRRGQISEGEYESMRARMVEKMAGRSAGGLFGGPGPVAGPMGGRPAAARKDTRRPGSENRTTENGDAPSKT